MKKLISAIFVYLLASTAVHAASFVLTSPQVKKGGRIAEEQVYNGFGCKGNNISPALQWKGAPSGTKSFAVTLYDPDAPTGSGWWHWVIFNIPANVTSLEKGAGDLCPAPFTSGKIIPFIFSQMGNTQFFHQFPGAFFSISALNADYFHYGQQIFFNR